jgi:hypothetical protein
MPSETDLSVRGPAGILTEPKGRLWPTLVALGVAALVLARLLPFSQTLGPPPTPTTPLTRASGRLIYAANLGPGWQRLWTLDLASGHLTRGPRIPRTSGLLAGWGDNWIAFTSQASDGGLVAYILTGVGPEDRPHRVAAGDLVTWDPTGVKVVAARHGSRTGSCGRAVAVTVAGPSPWGEDRVLSWRTLCRDVLSVGPAGALTYYTQASRARTSVYLVGFTASRRVLSGYALLSASPSGDLLVTHIEKPPTYQVAATTGSYDGSGHPTPDGPSELYLGGRGPPTPIRDGKREFRVGRVLAWSSDGTRALVVGQLGKQQGLFLIQTVSDDSVPQLLAEIDGEAAGGTFGEDDTAYLVGSNQLFQVRQDGPVPVSLPNGAPPPAGPIAWLP